MKIAQVAPLAESVPPRFYGGTERIVSYLTEELVRQGHSVTLFASGDSVTAARLHATTPTAWRLDPAVKDPLALAILQLEEVCERAHEFDVIHFHTDHLYLLRGDELAASNTLTTMHGRLDLPGYTRMFSRMFSRFPNAPLVSISDHQRTALPDAHWLGTVHHGLPNDVCAFERRAKGEYLAFLGRISPEKRVDRAIEIARRAGMRLRIAAKIDVADRAYYDREIAPLMSQPHVEYVGEIGERDKCEFLGRARALLFPIDWPEPFGLVMIEAMSCGTPCIAWRAGSVPEIIQENCNGFIIESIDEGVAAVRHAAALPRETVRESFQQRFTVERMTRDYVEIYRRLMARSPSKVAA